MPRWKHILFVFLFVLGELSLFFSSNIFYFFQTKLNYLKHWEAISAYLLFLYPLTFILYYIEQYSPKIKAIVFWRKSLSLCLVAFLLLSTHFITYKMAFSSKGLARFDNRYFQCMPYAPWPIHTELGQEAAHYLFEKLPLNIQYTWYSTEDVCRLEKIKSEFANWSYQTRAQCLEKDKYNCLLSLFDKLSFNSPFGTAGIILAQELVTSIRLELNYREKSKLDINLALLPLEYQDIERDRGLLEIQYRDLARLLSGTKWLTEAGILATIEYKSSQFPTRSVASISKKGKKMMAQDIFEGPSKTSSIFFQVLNGNQNEQSRRLANVDSQTWTSARIQFVDHLLRDQIYEDAKKEMANKGLENLKQMQSIISQTKIPSYEKKAYAKRLQALTRRYQLKF